MLVNLKEILAIAEERQIAVGSFNTPNLDSLLAVIRAAETLELPVIVQFAECHENLMPLSVIGPIMVSEARKASVPICVHLDHGETLDYIQYALDIGFTGVMYDGSTLPYEENVANTRQTVAMASKTNAGVEGELGSMGKRESGAGEGSGVEDDTKIYTDPVLAAKFIAETGIDALACSFGTTHGIYLTEPKLDFNVVQSVRGQTNHIPVVMHGGSGVSEADYGKAIEAGVRKINYFTYMDKAGGSALDNWVSGADPSMPLFFTEATGVARHAMQQNVESAMKIFAQTK